MVSKCYPVNTGWWKTTLMLSFMMLMLSVITAVFHVVCCSHYGVWISCSKLRWTAADTFMKHVWKACVPLTDELCRPVSQVVLLLLRSQLGGHHHWGPAGLLPWRVTGLRPVRPGPRRDTGQHTQTAAPSGVGVGHSPGVQTQRKSPQAGSVGEGPTWAEWVNFTLFNILSSLFHLETPEWCELCVLLA